MLSRSLSDFERGYRDGLRGTFSGQLRASHAYRTGHAQGASERLQRYINGNPNGRTRYHA